MLLHKLRKCHRALHRAFQLEFGELVELFCLTIALRSCRGIEVFFHCFVESIVPVAGNGQSKILFRAYQCLYES